MRKILCMTLLLLGISACGIQPQPTQDVSNIVIATFTAVVQKNSQVIAPQPTPIIVQLELTSVVDIVRLNYYWPTTIPEGFTLNSSNSSASEKGFTLELDNFSAGQVLMIFGGEDAIQGRYCSGDSTPQIIRGFEGCFPQSTGGGFGVQWKESDFQYNIGGMGLPQNFILQFAEQLEPLDINSWQKRLK